MHNTMNMMKQIPIWKFLLVVPCVIFFFQKKNDRHLQIGDVGREPYITEALFLNTSSFAFIKLSNLNRSCNIIIHAIRKG